MKTHNLISPAGHRIGRITLTALVGAMFAASSVFAATTWDANTGTTGPQDGAGTWDAGLTANWWNGTADVVWPNNTTTVAVIGTNSGAAGTINVSGTVTLNGISIFAAGSGSYALSGGTLSFGGTGPTISNTAALTPTINSVIGETSAGTAIRFAGIGISSGNITLGGANTFTGSPTVAQATVNYNLLTNGGSAGSFGAGASTVPIIVGNSGSAACIAYTGAGGSTDRPLNFNGVGTGNTVSNNGTGALNFNNTGTAFGSTAGNRFLTFRGSYTAGTNTFAQVINDMSGFVTTVTVMSNAWSLTGANTYSAGTGLSTGGVLGIGNATALGTGTLDIAGSSYIDNTAATDLTIANSLTVSNGSFTYIGSAHNLTINGPVALVGANRTITNTANTLTLGGQITGAFTLTKAGPGTLVLNNPGTADTHTGTAITAGTLDLGGTTQSLGAVAFSGTATTQNGTINGTSYTCTVTGGNTNTISANLAGTSVAFADSGLGTVALLGNNSYTGGTTLSVAGTMIITNDTGLGNSTGGLLFSGSGFLATSNYGSTALNNVTVGSSRTITINSGIIGGFTTLDTNNLTISAKITGAGAVNRKGSSFALGTVRFSGDTSDYTGDFITSFGNTEFTSVADQGIPSSLGAGALATGGQIGLSNATSSGTFRYVGSGNSVTHRALNLSGTTATYALDASGGGTIQFLATGNLRSAASGSSEFRLRGSNAGSNIFAQVINDTTTGVTSVSKFDNGTWILTAANTYSGALTNNSGTLLINGSVGGSMVTNIAGTLGGTGTINCPVYIQSAATLAPGAGGGSIGTLHVKSNLNLAGTVSMVINRTNSQTASLVTGISTVTYGGTLSISNSGLALLNGDAFALFTSTNYAGTFTTIALPALSAGLAWDTSGLPVNGSIEVVALPAVTVSPASTNLVYGNIATLTANATGSGTLFYQWYDPGSSAISGATNSTLSFAPTVTQSGIYSVVVTNNFGSATNTASITVSPAATSLAIGSSTNPALPGANITFTATVSVVAPGAGTPSGGVQFLTNGTVAGGVVPFTGASAQFSTAVLPHATNIVTAQYADDANFTGSTNSLNEIVNTPPVAGTANYSRPRDIALTIKISDLLTNVTDADGDALALFSFSTNSTNGAAIAAVSTNGVYLSYTPPATNGNVTDSFTYIAEDTFGATNAGTVVISILADTNAQSVNITGVSVLGDGTTQISFAGIPNRSYLIQATTNLTPTIIWTTIGTNTADTNGLFQFDDLDSTNFVTRYYRTAAP